MLNTNYAKPILFNDEMVRTILRGEKTVTRRLADVHAPMVKRVGNKYRAIFPDNNEESGYRLGGQIQQRYEKGDRLYVRETWSELKRFNKDGILMSSRYVYRATDEYPFGGKYIVDFKWHPSIHMPKEASRIALDVTNVELKHLQEMTEADAQKEGTKSLEDFARIWDSTIKPDMLEFDGWGADPWVFVYEFVMCG